MQEYKDKITNEKFKEFFEEKEGEDIEKIMDKRFKELQKEKENIELITRKKIGRNSPCPCGSGKKFKRCCIDKVKR